MDSRPCCQDGSGFLKQIKGASTSIPVQILFIAVVVGKAVTGALGFGLYLTAGSRFGFAPLTAW